MESENIQGSERRAKGARKEIRHNGIRSIIMKAALELKIYNKKRQQ